jgi:hypothetical protein
VTHWEVFLRDVAALHGHAEFLAITRANTSLKLFNQARSFSFCWPNSRARRLRGRCGVEVWVRSEPGFSLFSDAMVHAGRRQLGSVTHDPKRALERFRALGY